MHCYRHPHRETELSCIDCERPICVDCSIAAPVGIKCPACARIPRAARGAVPMVGQIRAGLAAGAMAAVVAALLMLGIRAGLFQLIVAWLVGMAFAEVARVASGGYRDRSIAGIAAAGAGAGFAVPLALDLATGGPMGVGEAFALLAVVAAVVGAWSRL